MTRTERRNRIVAINEEMKSLYNQVTSEKRQMTDDERAHVDSLKQERQGLVIENEIEDSERLNARMAEPGKDQSMARAIGEAIKGGAQSVEFRTFTGADSSSVEPLTPVTIGPVVESLTDGTIYGILPGLRIQYGMTGAWKIPVRGRYVASVENEGATVTGTDYQIAKVSPSPKRLAIGFDATQEAFIESGENVGKEILIGMTEAISEAINAYMFDLTGASSLKGFFHGLANSNKISGVASYANILKLKAVVDGAKVRRDNSAAYVMNSATAAVLESTLRGNGDRMILEEGKINGVPVFITEAVADNKVLFGYFSYGLLGFFGNMQLSVDTQSAAVARSGMVAYTANVRVDMAALRKEAFAILTLTAS